MFVITISIKNNNLIIFALRVGFLHKTASKLVFTNYRYPQIWALKSLFKNNHFLCSPSLSSNWIFVNLPILGVWWAVLIFKITSDTWYCTIKFIAHQMMQSTIWTPQIHILWFLMYVHFTISKEVIKCLPTARHIVLIEIATNVLHKEGFVLPQLFFVFVQTSN